MIVASLLCAVGLATFGVPVIQLGSKDLSTPFPCQHKACGCMNAEACWRKCCCHTNSEKVAWADKHGVVPPDYVVAAAERECKTPARACCAPQPQTQTQVASETTAAADDLVANEPANDSAAVANDDSSPAPRVALVQVNDYRACQGLAAIWLILGHALPCDTQPVPLPRPVAGQWLTTLSESGECFARQPEPPRPKATLA